MQVQEKVNTRNQALEYISNINEYVLKILCFSWQCMVEEKEESSYLQKFYLMEKIFQGNIFLGKFSLHLHLKAFYLSLKISKSQ